MFLIALFFVEGTNLLDLFLEQLIFLIDFAHFKAKEIDLLALLVELIKLSSLLGKFLPYFFNLQLMLFLQSFLQLIALLLPGCIILFEPACHNICPLDFLLSLNTAPHFCHFLLVGRHKQPVLDLKILSSPQPCPQLNNFIMQVYIILFECLYLAFVEVYIR